MHSNFCEECHGAIHPSALRLFLDFDPHDEEELGWVATFKPVNQDQRMVVCGPFCAIALQQFATAEE
jgi:hypothetical protein